MRFAAIGDSFTEGIGDELADGTPRGWADLVAVGLASETGEPVSYVNLAIRGRLLAPIVAEQLPAALALRPDLLMVNGGGNDIMRPGADADGLLALIARAVRLCAEQDVRLVVASGADPSERLPAGRIVRRRAQALGDAVQRLCVNAGIDYADNWNDVELRRAVYWSPDRLHLNAAGHARVAGRTLTLLGVAAPASWLAPAVEIPVVRSAAGTIGYYREHVLPWVQRRLTGRSSGDDRTAKHPDWYEVPAVTPWPPVEPG